MAWLLWSGGGCCFLWFRYFIASGMNLWSLDALFLLQQSDIWALISGNGAKTGRKDAKKHPPGPYGVFQTSFCLLSRIAIVSTCRVCEQRAEDRTFRINSPTQLVWSSNYKTRLGWISKMWHAFDECLSAESNLKGSGRLRSCSHLPNATNQLFPECGNLICSPAATHR